MSLSIGDLAGYLTLDDSKFESGLEGAQEKFTKVGGWLKTHGKEIGLAAGAAVGAAVTFGFVKNMEFDAANDRLRAQLGLSGKDAAIAGKVAGELYANNMTDSMDGANDAIKAVVQQMNVSVRSADLKPLATQALGVANILDEDVGPTAAAAGTLIKTGLAKNGKEAFDILTRGAQLGINKGEDLIDTFTEYPTTFRQLGISGKDALGLMNQGLQAGARNSDQVADAIKEFSIRAIDGSKTTRQGFKLMGLDAGKMREEIAKGGPSAKKAFGMVLDGLRSIDDPAKRQTAAVDLFGTKAEDMGRALQSMDLSNASKQIGKVGGATDRAVNAMSDNAQSKIDGFKHKIDLWAASLVNVDGPLGTVAAGVMAFGGQAASTLAPLGSMVIAMRAQKVAAAAAAAATEGQAVAQRGLNLALISNPIGIVIAALVALGVGLVVAYKKSETFRSFVQKAFHAVAEAGRWMWNNVLQPAFHLLIEAIATVLTMWSKMLGALGHVPGFGWAKKASEAMADAAQRARDLGDKVQKIPNQAKVTIVDNTAAKIAATQEYIDKLRRLNGSVAKTYIEQIKRNGPVAGGGHPVPPRAGGGPVTGGMTYRVNEHGQEYWTAPGSGHIYPVGSPEARGAGGINIHEGAVQVNMPATATPESAAEAVGGRVVAELSAVGI